MTGRLRDRVATLGGVDGRQTIYLHRWSVLVG